MLDKLLLGVKELQVKIGNKQHPLVLAYRTDMRAKIGASAEEDQVDEATKREDYSVMDSIQLMLKEYEAELTKPLPGKKSIPLHLWMKGGKVIGNYCALYFF